MTSRFQPIAAELESLKSRFTVVTNRIWDLRLERASAGAAEDFLPRRLLQLEAENVAHFARLHARLQTVLQKNFSRNLFAIDSNDDLPAIHSITQDMAYIRNAFSDAPYVAETIRLLKSALASQRVG